MNKLIRQAFTLIELLVVIAIIGILSGLIVVSMSGVTQKASIAKAQVFSNSLRNSLMLNLVSEWKFDTSILTDRSTINADVVDTWGGVNNGTIPASPSIPTTKTSSNCVSGSCLSFDGGDYISGANNLSLTATPISISAWVNFTDFNTGNQNPRIFEIADNTYDIQIIRDSATSSFTTKHNEYQLLTTGTRWSTPVVGTWYHLVVVFNAATDTTLLYVNGDSQASNGLSNIGAGNQVNKFYMGARSDLVESAFLKGRLDDVRMYNAAIPTSQIKEQYYVGLNNMLNDGSISKENYLSRINLITNE
ncbi:MAG: LamG-like jellyroll fold domain-containing protein [Candidatus Paceibacterota bacterium]|jgi:prepilin-type N-terminal cleavage/methylation domain-containing protein